jgi:hypothetical protein
VNRGRGDDNVVKSRQSGRGDENVVQEGRRGWREENVVYGGDEKAMRGQPV